MRSAYGSAAHAGCAARAARTAAATVSGVGGVGTRHYARRVARVGALEHRPVRPGLAADQVAERRLDAGTGAGQRLLERVIKGRISAS